MRLLPFFFSTLLLFTVTADAGLPDATAEELNAGRAVQALLESHPRDTAAPHPMLRVVYFTPSDVEPQKDHQQRITRIMQDISIFYRDGMKRYGLRSEGLPLEMENGQVKLYEVKGKLKADGYRHESGNETEAEMREALKGVIDFDREFVLALYGMCRKNENGSYFFYAPYYGKVGSDQRSGLCHAADCELLDPALLSDTKGRIFYEEHYGKFTKSMADFNTAYMGGIAHELGHGLSLPHDGESAAQRTVLGASLMGGGNLTYARDRWKQGPGQGAFLSLASALRLAAHPLFTGGSADRFQKPAPPFAGLQFTPAAGKLQITGRLESNIKCCAVIAYIDPPGRGDYDAQTFCSIVKDEAFSLTASIDAGALLKSGAELRLTAVHLNGATSVERRVLTVDESSNIKVEAAGTKPGGEAAVAGPEPVQILERLADRLIAAADNTEKPVLERLRKSLTTPPAPAVSPAEAKGEVLQLSDAAWERAKVGWGVPMRNRMGSPAVLTGPFIRSGGHFIEHGLYAHSPSEYRFQLDGKWTTLTATAAISEGDTRNATFVIMGDGRELYRSALLESKQPKDIKVDVTGVKSLTFKVEEGTGPQGHSWAVWVEPKLTRAK